MQHHHHTRPGALALVAAALALAVAAVVPIAAPARGSGAPSASASAKRAPARRGVARRRGAARRRAPAVVRGHTIYQSRYLWATIDICDTKAHPHTLGVRGSIPGSGRPAERMFMRFRVQFLSSSDHHWHYVIKGADSGFQDVGSAHFRFRQSGWSFQFVPTAGSGGFTLRGVVDFEWRQGRRVVRSARKGTAKGHQSAAGIADPPGYSSDTCVIH